MKKQYRYDVAISFAEEDRNAAVALAQALEMKGLSSYYYPEKRTVDVGQILEQRLKDVYSEEAQCAIALFSEAYFKEGKIYPGIELAAILSRMEQDPGIAYLIPVKLEDFAWPAEYTFLENRIYIEWNFQPDQIADILVQLLGKELVNASENTDPKSVIYSGGEQVMIIAGSNISELNQHLIKYEVQAVSFPGLAKKYKWPIVGAILLICITITYRYLFSTNHKQNIVAAESIIPKPVFDSNDKRFKVLILPFDKECEYEGIKYDIGKSIFKRLEALNIKDSLNLSVYYLRDSLDYGSLTRKVADSIMRFHYADETLFGAYSLRECEGGSSDKVCYNYLVNSDKWHLEDKQFNVSNEMINLPGIEALREGMGQEDIDNIVYWVAGTSAFKAHDYTRAIKLLGICKNFKGKQVVATIAVCYYYLKNYEECIKKCKQAIDLDPSRDDMWNIKGAAYSEISLRKEGFECFKKALEINPNDKRLLYNSAQMCLILKDTAAAISYLKKSEKGDSVYKDYDDRTFLMLGHIYFYKSDYIKSLFYFGKDVKLNPNHSFSWMRLGEIYNAFKSYPRSLFCFSNVLRINPCYNKALLSVGAIFAFNDFWSFSRIAYLSAIDADPTIIATWNVLGEFALANNDFISTKRYFSRALELDTTKASSWFKAGKISLLLKDTADAIYKLERSRNLDDTTDDACKILVQIYDRRRDRASSKRILEKLIDRNPKNTWAWSFLGYTYFMQNDTAKAITLLRKVADQTDNYTAAYFLSMVYSFRKERANTLLYLKMAISKNNMGKIKARKNKLFEWLWQDNDFITISAMHEGEKISKDDIYFDLFMRKDKEYYYRTYKSKNKFKNPF